MAKSARASVVKKNRSNLKKKVFGPVETARNERLSSKLLALASQPKAPRAEMEVEQDEAKESTASTEGKEQDRTTEDVDMDAENAATAKPAGRSNRSFQRQKTTKAAKVEKKRVRKPRNTIVFKQNPHKAKKGKKR